MIKDRVFNAKESRVHLNAELILIENVRGCFIEIYYHFGSEESPLRRVYHEVALVRVERPIGDFGGKIFPKYLNELNERNASVNLVKIGSDRDFV